MKKPIILIAEPNYSKKAIVVYKKLGPVYFWFDENKGTREKLLKVANILVIRLMLNVRKDLIDKMPNLKVIATSTTGLNHIDVDYAEKKGIKVISLRGEISFLKNIPSTAEETWGLILALVRNIPWAFDDVKNGNWNTNRWIGHQLMGKTLGILGLGRLGKIMAGYGRIFKMNVIASDPFVSAKEMKKLGAKKVTMNNLFKNSDIVSVHVALNDKTRDLIKEKHLKTMKSTAYFVNTARAELVEAGALEKALSGKYIIGAAVDVMRDEKDNAGHLKNSKLLEYARKNNNLIILPHIGGTTYEAMEITQNFIAGKVKERCSSILTQTIL